LDFIWQRWQMPQQQQQQKTPSIFNSGSFVRFQFLSVTWKRGEGELGGGAKSPGASFSPALFRSVVTSPAAAFQIAAKLIDFQSTTLRLFASFFLSFLYVTLLHFYFSFYFLL